MRSLARRVEKLESSQPGRDERPALDLGPEYARWEDALDAVERLLAGAAPLDPVVEYFRGELVNLPYILSPGVSWEGKGGYWLESVRRVPAATVLLFDRLSPDLRAAAAGREAFGYGVDRPWARAWVHALAWLDCRLPPDAAPGVVGGIAADLAGRRFGTDPGAVTCPGCGLRRPGAARGEIGGCPQCGDPSEVRVGIGDGRGYPWWELARAELDPRPARGVAGTEPGVQSEAVRPGGRPFGLRSRRTPEPSR